MSTYCPATMCPLIAPDGSPWTGEKNGVCPQKEPDRDANGNWLGSGCGFWHGFGGTGCDGCSAAHHQVAEAANGEALLVIGPNKPRRLNQTTSKEYDCPRAKECQWQIEADAEGGLCPPRSALRLGLDARVCLW